MTEFTFFSFFNLLAGLSFFLYGMKFAEKGLRKISAQRLREYIHFLTRNRVTGVLSGTVITFMTQSSTATSVILIGLTSAGLMSLVQAVGMLLGADIGTTLTVQLFTFKVYRIAPLMIAAGFYFYAFSPSVMRQRIGQIIMAVGMVFFGMEMMTASVEPLQHNPFLVGVLHSSNTNVWAALLISALFTALVHSSAATIAIIIAFAASMDHGSALTLAGAVPLVLGANIGTCATALIAAAQAGPEARKVAWAHTMLKVFGVLVFLPFLTPFTHLSALTSDNIVRQIANAHSIFNVLIALVFLPFVGPFVRFIEWLVPKKQKEEAGYHVEYISKHVLSVPALALGQAAREIVRMSGLVTKMVQQTIEVFIASSEPLRRRLIAADDEVDFLQEALVPFLSHLSQEELTAEQSAKAVQLLTITAELEHTADVVSKNLMDHARKKIEKGFLFSEEGWKEIKAFHAKTVLVLEQAISAFTLNNEDMAREILEERAAMDAFLEKLRQSHIARLQRGLRETLETTTVHLDLLDDMNQIGKHAFRIAALIVSGSPNVKISSESAASQV